MPNANLEGKSVLGRVEEGSENEHLDISTYITHTTFVLNASSRYLLSYPTSIFRCRTPPSFILPDVDRID